MTWKRIAAVVGFNLGLVGIGLATLEIGFGNWFQPQRLNRLSLIRDRTLHYDVSQLYRWPERMVVYRRDHFGFRGSYGNPSLIDILTVGGSTTDQRYISEGATWQDVLQRDFMMHDKTVRIANAGVDGHSTFGHLRSFEWWFPNVPQLRAKHVLFYVGLNDLHSAAPTEHDELLRSNGNSVIGLVEENSAIENLIRTVVGTYRAMVFQEVGHASVDFGRCDWVDRPLLSDHRAVMKHRLDVYADRLRELADRTRGLGAKPIFVTQTSRRYKWFQGRLVGVSSPLSFDGLLINGMDYAYLLQMLNEETMRMSKEQGCLALNLANDVEFTDDDFYDFSHPTPQGTAKVGHYLYEKLQGLF